MHEYRISTPSDESYWNLLGKEETPEIVDANISFKGMVWDWMSGKEEVVSRPQCLSDAKSAIRLLFQITRHLKEESDAKKQSNTEMLEELQEQVQLVDRMIARHIPWRPKGEEDRSKED